MHQLHLLARYLDTRCASSPHHFKCCRKINIFFNYYSISPKIIFIQIGACNQFVKVSLVCAYVYTKKNTVKKIIRTHMYELDSALLCHGFSDDEDNASCLE